VVLGVAAAAATPKTTSNPKEPPSLLDYRVEVCYGSGCFTNRVSSRHLGLRGDDPGHCSITGGSQPCPIATRTRTLERDLAAMVVRPWHQWP